LQTGKIVKENIPMDRERRNKEERKAVRLQWYREELVELIEQAIREDGELQVLEGVHLGRLSAPMEKVYSVL
jgi:succinylglutamate desuccinylase